MTLIISKSAKFVNYDADKFLQGMLIDLLCGEDKGEIYWKKYTGRNVDGRNDDLDDWIGDLIWLTSHRNK